MADAAPVPTPLDPAQRTVHEEFILGMVCVMRVQKGKQSCNAAHCAGHRALVQHVLTCTDEGCEVRHCTEDKAFVAHFDNCRLGCAECRSLIDISATANEEMRFRGVRG